ncbi:MAG: hypothetical protein JWQ21_3477 [Herminiimonas sp.]|nr:hypothetical protein [Herminiimonas sp.]
MFARIRGQAMVELLIVAALVLVPLFLAIPLLGKYLDMRAAAVQTSRYAAWERTVWFGGAAASGLGWISPENYWQANAKTDEQIRNELGVRQLSETGAADSFSSSDRDAVDFKGSTKTLWQDRRAQPLLANYDDDIKTSVNNGDAPGTLNLILTPIADLAATLGPFRLEMKGKYGATVTIKVKDIDYDHFLAKTSTSDFSETNILLANGWSADGPDDKDKTSVKQQVKGLVPTSIISAEFEGVKIIDYVLAALSLLAPEASKLEPGKIAPDVVPADRLK